MAVNPDLHPGVNFPWRPGSSSGCCPPRRSARSASSASQRFGQPLFYPDSGEYQATRDRSRSRPARPAGRSLVGRPAGTPESDVGKPHGGRREEGAARTCTTGSGASLEGLSCAGGPRIGDARHAGSRIVVTSSDGWTATVWWDELFSTLPRGDALYSVKGCNECHGVQGRARRPLASGRRRRSRAGHGRSTEVLALLRAGREAHAGMNGYTEDQLRRAICRR